MAGYTRQDTANNIANGNVIDADDLDSEFNAIEGAFNSASGHNHDGSAGQGAPITKVGPGQDVVVSTTAVLPKTTNTLDLGGNSIEFKDAFFDGTVRTDNLTVDENATISGTLNVSAGITGALTGNASTATAWQTARTLTLSGDVTGTVSGIDGTDNIAVTTTVGNDSHTHTSGFITDFVEATQDVVGGMVAGNTEQGITVTYDDSLGKLNFDVNDPVITLSGDVAGSATMTNLGNVTIATTVQPNSVALGTDTTGNYVASLVAGTGVTLANNTGETATPTVSIGQAVATTSNVLFNQVTTTGDAIIGGNLTVSGTTTTVNTEVINLADNIITLNSNEAGTPSQNAGIEVERGTAVNKTLVWDEANDRWTVGSDSFVAGTFIGSVSGNVTGNLTGNVTGNASTATTLQTARTIALSGDVSGSASFNGGSNITISAAVANDSHTHDGRYYTEAESDNRYAYKAGAIGQNFSAARILVANGSTTSPSIAFNSDGATDTGLYWGGDGFINFTTNGTYAGAIDPSGNLTMAGNVTAYSDERLKSDIVTIPNALEKVQALRGVNYIKDGKASTGVIAQEVQKVIPEVVQQNDEYLSVAYGNLVGVLIEAVKELSAEVEALKAK